MSTRHNLTGLHIIVAAALLALLSSACGPAGSPVQAPADMFDPRTDTGTEGAVSLTLAPGQSVTVGEVDPLRIGFERVTGDSRCPPDVACVWEGEVTVELRVARADADTVATLHSVREPRQVEYAGQAILLTGVTPEPRRSGIEPTAYRATLAVARK